MIMNTINIRVPRYLNYHIMNGKVLSNALFAMALFGGCSLYGGNAILSASGRNWDDAQGWKWIESPDVPWSDAIPQVPDQGDRVLIALLDATTAATIEVSQTSAVASEVVVGSHYAQAPTSQISVLNGGLLTADLLVVGRGSPEGPDGAGTLVVNGGEVVINQTCFIGALHGNNGQLLLQNGTLSAVELRAGQAGSGDGSLLSVNLGNGKLMVKGDAYIYGPDTSDENGGVTLEFQCGSDDQGYVEIGGKLHLLGLPKMKIIYKGSSAIAKVTRIPLIHCADRVGDLALVAVDGLPPSVGAELQWSNSGTLEVVLSP